MNHYEFTSIFYPGVRSFHDMKYTSQSVRKAFHTFFEEKKHQAVPSASLVPGNDPTLLFTNAGMNQFKDVFLGEGTRPYDRAVDTQKCLRVSGKHNDLEEVGYDTYHHTFFEMLGNWSFGDYFKKEAIQWAWELLVERWGLAPERLYATVHEGDENLGLDADEEAAAFWASETTIPKDHIMYFDSKDNFWMMGDTGPCGPCSEVHVDLRSDEERKKVDGKTLVNADHPKVIEIWNLVFIQYNALGNNQLEPLAAKHVDTGMGFERMLAVLQGKFSTYDTDLFAPLLQTVAELTPIKAIAGYDAITDVSDKEREKYRIAMRVIVDHIRTCAFAISDGVSPGNAGREYVIRRILRRAVRYGYQTLQLTEPFLFKLVQPLVDKMGDAFPALEKQQEYIERVIKAEEVGFLETLGVGLGYFEQLVPYVEMLQTGSVKDVQAAMADDSAVRDLLAKAYGDMTMEDLLPRLASDASNGKVPGEIAFLFHDTYGFPVDLTDLMARESGLEVNLERYDALMQEQKNRARAASGFKLDMSQADKWEVVNEADALAFVGYEELDIDDARVHIFRTAKGAGDTLINQIVLDKTPFYAESGGQVGDTGTLEIGGEVLTVEDTLKINGQHVHVVDRLPASLEGPVKARVDRARRAGIKKHHSATHLLHASLRQHLGEHVAQKGSLVDSGRLRFDFSHFEKVTDEQLQRIEHQVNGWVQSNIPRQEERDVPIEEAMKRGAMALFGEKYGDSVRMITFDPDISIELCGGTHVDATGEIGLFRLVSEGSVAAGVRRVEAVVGEAALAIINAEREELERTRRKFKSLSGSVDSAVSDLLAENKRLQKEVSALNKAQLGEKLDAFIAEARQVGEATLVTGRLDGIEMEDLRDLGQVLRDRLGGRSVGVLGAVSAEGEKAFLVASVSDDLIKSSGVKAGTLVGMLAKRIGGGGGGKPMLATAGGRQPEKLDETLAAADEVLQSILE